MEFDLITNSAASALGFAIGWGASWLAGKDVVAQLRARVASKQTIIDRQEKQIREQGRNIAHYVAAEQQRSDMLSEAGRKGAAASNARHQTKAALKDAAARVTRPAKAPAPKAKSTSARA